MSMPSIDQLRRAIQIQEQITKLEDELRRVLSGVSGAVPSKEVTAAKPAKKKKGKMSAQGRANIIAAQKARWAKSKGTTSATPKPAAIKAAKPAKKVKRTMSAEARAKISAAAKKRWAGKKA